MMTALAIILAAITMAGLVCLGRVEEQEQAADAPRRKP